MEWYLRKLYKNHLDFYVPKASYKKKKDRKQNYPKWEKLKNNVSTKGKGPWNEADNVSVKNEKNEKIRGYYWRIRLSIPLPAAC